MKRFRPVLWGFFTAVWLTAGGGCSSLLAPQPDQTRYFLLSAEPDMASASVPTSTEALALGPISFPDYLSRPEMITRTADNRIEVAPNARWAEPLDLTFKRILATDLSTALHGVPVFSFPWFGGGPHFRYRVEPVIDRFEAGPDQAAHLVAHWTVIDGRSDQMVAVEATAITVPMAGDGHPAQAVALSAAIDQYARAIAAKIRELR